MKSPLLYILSFVFFALNSGAQDGLEAERKRLEVESMKANSYEIAFISTTALLFTAGTTDNVLTNPEFQVLCKGRRAASDLLKGWKMINKVIETPTTSPPDVRIVFRTSETTVAFNSNGSAGYLNDKAVKFSNETKSWFLEHIHPLSKAFFHSNDKK